MRIINAHSHLYELSSQDIRELFDFAQSSVLLNAESHLPLLNPSELLKQMDEAGVEISVLMAEESPIIHSSNEYVAKVCRLCPERFIGFGSVNPLSPKAAEQVDKLVNKLGMRGLSFHPPMQNFAPNDPKVFPVYEKAQKLNIPIAFHVGTTPMGSRCRLSYAHPLLLDDVAFEFPNLKMIITHLGTLYHNESFMVAEKNPNVYLDTGAYLHEISQLLTPELIKRVGEHKIMFASNYPMPFGDEIHRIKDYVSCIRKLPLDDSIKKKIFSENFLQMMDSKPQSKQYKARDSHLPGTRA